MREMTCLCNRLYACLRKQRGIAKKVLGRDDTVTSPTQQQHRRLHPMQPMLELWIVHVRLPGDKREGLAIARGDEKLVIAHGSKLGRVVLGIVESPLVQRFLRHGENIRNVELVRAAGLYPDGADAGETSEPLRKLARDLGGDPAADGEPDHVDTHEAEAIHELEIDMADVVHAFEPIRERRSTETGMRRSNDASLLCDQVQERNVWADTGAAMQIEDGLAASALKNLQLDAGYGGHTQRVTRIERQRHTVTGLINATNARLQPAIPASPTSPSDAHGDKPCLARSRSRCPL